MRLLVDDYYGKTYEIVGIPDDSPWQDIEREFRGLGVAMGFSPTILDDEEERWK